DVARVARQLFQRGNQAVFFEADGKETACHAASLGYDVVQKPADLLSLRGFADAAFLEFVRQVRGHEGDASQLLANAVVEIVADPALLPIADFEDLALQPLALSDIARNAFDL